MLVFPGMQCFKEEIRQRLDEMGNDEIPIIYTAVEMAKAMVNLKIIQTPRTYPSDALRAKPKFR